MSNKQSKVTTEEEQKPAISLDDAKNIREFFKHFNIPWTDRLEKAVAAFEANQTVDNQELVKQALCVTIAESTHDAFLDKMFAAVRTQSTEIAYRAQFDTDLEEVLTEEQRAKLAQQS